ncbi:hypothetical protein PCH_Pc13g04970 [Penicillium rubens Wisconsin 54-1255]|uniref:Uncharacterized protein n=1 Tax=Penicillium rubens (strain ATCC 28089 / DSM 1075 / NRRL 1951 / Wisconsin 54-1255) TaxID=500485 RepID=B6H2D5_PENRW|nr:hypothetical protein PCH_Pc13g04970 [Penicillium rubens Wisconsin 54-1255]
MATLTSSGKRRRESSEDETQRLFETLGDAATISIKIGRIAGATINEGPASTMVPSRGNASGKCPRGKEKCGIPQGGKSAVGAKTFGGKWQGSDFEGEGKEIEMQNKEAGPCGERRRYWYSW